MIAMNEAVRLKQRLVSIFKRKGRDGRHTRLFENLDPWQKDLLSGMVPLQEEEVPVIGGVESPEKWFLITSKRIVWLAAGKIQSIPITRVYQARMDFDSVLRSGRTKLETQELQVETLDDERYTLAIEEGLPLVGVWNVLKHLGFRNRKKADTNL